MPARGGDAKSMMEWSAAAVPTLLTVTVAVSMVALQHDTTKQLKSVISVQMEYSKQAKAQ